MPLPILDIVFAVLLAMTAALVIVTVLNAYYARKIGQQTGSAGPWSYIVAHCIIMVVVSLLILSLFFPTLIDGDGLSIVLLSIVGLFADAVVVLIGLHRLNGLFERQ